MPIDMSNVKKIEMPFPATIYKKTFSFTNSDVVYRGTSTPCPIEVTLYSTTTPAWTGGSDTSTLDFYNYVHDTLGYGLTGRRYYLIVDNPYDCEYISNGQSCVLASCQLRNIRVGDSYFVPWFSVPGAGSVNAVSAYTITEKTGWVLVGTFNEYDYYNNAYSDTTSGSYTYFSASKDILTGEEYITNYCINGVSYPNVTITSVSGDTYYLSDGHSYTPSQYKMNFKDFRGSIQEVYSIMDITGNILWEKAGAYGYYIKVGGYYLNYASGYNVTTSNTASTAWHLEDDNRLSCLDGGTKMYLQCKTSDNSHPVYVDTTVDSNYAWVYKNGSYITASINGTKYYLYRYGSGTGGVRMHTASTVVTFQRNDPRTHTPDWHTIWEGDYSITCEAINGQIIRHPESNMVVYHIFPKISFTATAYSDMQIKVYYQFDWIGNKGTSTPGNSYITEYTVSNLSSDKTILNLPVNPTDGDYSVLDFIASGVAWDVDTGNIIFETRGILHPKDKEHMKTTIRITKIELYC